MLNHGRDAIRPRLVIALIAALVPSIAGLGLAATTLASGAGLPAPAGSESGPVSTPLSGPVYDPHVKIQLLIGVTPATLKAAGTVTYTYLVGNPGWVPLADVAVTDTGCSPVKYVSGDANSDNLLQPGEYWTFTCSTTVTATTTDAATATGVGDTWGIQVSAGNSATVTVTP